jgi:hypothetical protein
MMMKKKILK